MNRLTMTHSAQRNAILDAVVGALPDPVFVIDENGRYVDVIGGSGEDLPISQAYALVGKSLYDVMPREVADRFMQSIRSVLEGGQARIAEYQLASEEAPQWFEARIASVATEPGQPRQVACVSANITHRKHLQNLLEEAAGLESEMGGERGRFMQTVADEITRQSRYKDPFCLLLLELDHFEAIAETFGEDVADSCSLEVSRIIRQELRHSDVLATLEQDQFGILLINTPMNWGLEVGERIRRRVAYMPFSAPGRTLHLTVSGGLTDFRASDSTKEMFERARKALTKSLNAGRDRVSVG